MLLVALLGGVPVLEKYDHMGVLGYALCWRRWRNLRPPSNTGFLCPILVASMAVDSPVMLFFFMSRKRVTDQFWRKTFLGAPEGMTPSLSWNCMFWKNSWTVLRWELVFVYLQDRRQKKRAI